MRAAVYRQTGKAEDVLTIIELPDPQPCAGEVRIRILVSGVNPSDTKARAGISSPTVPYDLVVPHHDGAGVVDATGPGVDSSWVGKQVWFTQAQWQRQFGSAAEFVCLPVHQVAELPQNVPHEVGAAIGIPLITAHHAVTRFGNIHGQTVLVTGGAGSVGFYAAQLAKRAGARVITTVSTPEKAEQAKLSGADLVLCYGDTQDFVRQVMSFTDGKGVNVIIEVNASANAPHYVDLLAFGGRGIVYGSQEPEIPVNYRGMMRRFASLHFFVVYLLSREELDESIAACNGLLQCRGIRHLPFKTFPLEDIARAHAYVESGAMGKALISFV